MQIGLQKGVAFRSRTSSFNAQDYRMTLDLDYANNQPRITAKLPAKLIFVFYNSWPGIKIVLNRKSKNFKRNEKADTTCRRITNTKKIINLTAAKNATEKIRRERHTQKLSSNRRLSSLLDLDLGPAKPPRQSCRKSQKKLVRNGGGCGEARIIAF